MKTNALSRVNIHQCGAVSNAVECQKAQCINYTVAEKCGKEEKRRKAKYVENKKV